MMCQERLFLTAHIVRTLPVQLACERTVLGLLAKVLGQDLLLKGLFPKNNETPTVVQPCNDVVVGLIVEDFHQLL